MWKIPEEPIDGLFVIVHCESKKHATLVLDISLANVDRPSKFLQCGADALLKGLASRDQR